MTILNEELQAIKERCEAATDGPWKEDEYGRFIQAHYDNWPTICETEWCGLPPTLQKKNGEFIAHARTDIPALVAHIAAQQAALEQAWYVLDSAAAGVAPKAAATSARNHIEKFIGPRESNFDDANNAELHEELAKVEEDKAILITTLEYIERALSHMHHRNREAIVIRRALAKVCAALARVKGDVCPKK